MARDNRKMHDLQQRNTLQYLCSYVHAHAATYCLTDMHAAAAVGMKYMYMLCISMHEYMYMYA